MGGHGELVYQVPSALTPGFPDGVHTCLTSQLLARQRSAGYSYLRLNTKYEEE